MTNEDIISKKEIKITLRDNKVYSVLPLTINELIDIIPIVEKLENKSQKVDIELFSDIKKLVKVALRDQAKGKDVGDLVDMLDIQKIIAAIMGQDIEALQNMIKAKQ